MPLASYWRLEKGRALNPGLRDLTNCAIVLGVALEDLIEDDWRDWSASRAGSSLQPPTGAHRVDRPRIAPHWPRPTDALPSGEMKAIYVFGWVFDDALGTGLQRELTVSELLHHEAYDEGWDEDRVRDTWAKLERVIAAGYCEVWERGEDDQWGEILIARDRGEVERQMREWARATGFGDLVSET